MLDPLSAEQQQQSFLCFTDLKEALTMEDHFLGVQKANVFTAPKVRLHVTFLRKNWRSFAKKQYFCTCNGNGRILNARKGMKVAKHCIFPMICGPGGSKRGSLKRRVRSQQVTGAMENCTPLWREAHFQVKRYKTLRSGHFWKLRCRNFQVKMYKTHLTTFGSCDVEKVHAVVARSTF